MIFGSFQCKYDIFNALFVISIIEFRGLAEKEKNLKLLESITSKKPKLDINKAVGKQINKEDKEKNEEKAKMNRGNKKGKGGKGKKSAKGNFKNRGAGKNFGKGKKNTGGAAKKRVGGKRR